MRAYEKIHGLAATHAKFNFFPLLLEDHIAFDLKATPIAAEKDALAQILRGGCADVWFESTDPRDAKKPKRPWAIPEEFLTADDVEVKLVKDLREKGLVCSVAKKMRTGLG